MNTKHEDKKKSISDQIGQDSNLFPFKLGCRMDDPKNHDFDTNISMHINAHIGSWAAVAQRLCPLFMIKTGVIRHGVCLTG